LWKIVAWCIVVLYVNHSEYRYDSRNLSLFARVFMSFHLSKSAFSCRSICQKARFHVVPFVAFYTHLHVAFYVAFYMASHVAFFVAFFVDGCLCHSLCRNSFHVSLFKRTFLSLFMRVLKFIIAQSFAQRVKFCGLDDTSLAKLCGLRYAA